MRVLPRRLFPPDEQDLFVIEGDQTLKVFLDSHAWYGGFSQELTLEPGRYRFSVRVFGDLVKGYVDGKKVWANDEGMRDGRARFTINHEQYGEWMAVIPGQWRGIVHDFDADGPCIVGVDFMLPFALKNNGLFCDAWTLERIPPEPPPVVTVTMPRAVADAMDMVAKWWREENP